MNLKIIEYSNQYDEVVKDLLVELQEYISCMDREGYNIVTKNYREKYFEKVMNEVEKYEGKIFLAKDQDKIVGLIVGIINNEFVSNYDFTAPKRGRVTELIISKKYRTNGVGEQLLNQMEKYFKEVQCKGILINVFAYNENANKFYDKKGYFNRNIEMMKKI